MSLKIIILKLLPYIPGGQWVKFFPIVVCNVELKWDSIIVFRLCNLWMCLWHLTHKQLQILQHICLCYCHFVTICKLYFDSSLLQLITRCWTNNKPIPKSKMTHLSLFHYELNCWQLNYIDSRALGVNIGHALLSMNKLHLCKYSFRTNWELSGHLNKWWFISLINMCTPRIERPDRYEKRLWNKVKIISMEYDSTFSIN